ncbi:MAG: hypothetical protein ACRET2_08345 [Steroidobacteraceae bacterium]
MAKVVSETAIAVEVPVTTARPSSSASLVSTEGRPQSRASADHLPAAQNQYKIRGLAEAPVAIPGLLVV